jgi:hypothetical protein
MICPQYFPKRHDHFLEDRHFGESLFPVGNILCFNFYASGYPYLNNKSNAFNSVNCKYLYIISPDPGK